jgi:CRISPR-associated protein Csb2
VIWLDLERPLASWKVLRLTETLRAAVIDHADRLTSEGAAGSRAPWQLHGHGVPGDIELPYQLVRYLGLPNVGHEHSDGALHGAAVWVPAATGADTVELIRSSISRITHLSGTAVKVGISLRASTGGKWSTRPQRWIGPSRLWASATPVVAERGRRSGPTAADVRAWFIHAGHPAPDVIRVSAVPTLSGAARLSGRDVHRSNRDRHPYYWLDVEFGEPVAGPVCIGRSRSFGLGLLAPQSHPTDHGRGSSR